MSAATILSLKGLLRLELPEEVDNLVMNEHPALPTVKHLVGYRTYDLLYYTY